MAVRISMISHGWWNLIYWLRPPSGGDAGVRFRDARRRTRLKPAIRNDHVPTNQRRAQGPPCVNAQGVASPITRTNAITAANRPTSSERKNTGREYAVSRRSASDLPNQSLNVMRPFLMRRPWKPRKRATGYTVSMGSNIDQAINPAVVHLAIPHLAPRTRARQSPSSSPKSRKRAGAVPVPWNARPSTPSDKRRLRPAVSTPFQSSPIETTW